MESSASHNLPDEDSVRRQEAALLERCRTGDLAAFDELVALHETRVYNLAYRLTGDPEDAADAAQKALVRAFRSLSTFRGDASFATWLYRIVTNVCLDEVRRKDRQRRTEFSVDNEGDEAADLVTEERTVETLAEQAERQRVVHEALQTLPDRQRAVVVLYDIQGFSYEEIAGILATSVGTVKSRLNRARLALKNRLEPNRELFGV